MASVGLNTDGVAYQVPHDKVKISIISTGDELTDPSGEHLQPGKIFDSNTTMLKSLLEQHGFKNVSTVNAKDS